MEETTRSIEESIFDINDSIDLMVLTDLKTEGNSLELWLEININDTGIFERTNELLEERSLLGHYEICNLIKLDQQLTEAKLKRELKSTKVNIDFRLILALVTSAMTLIDKDFPRSVPKGDAGLYLLCRLFCQRLEERNPGIAESVNMTPIG